ncbi:MAG: alginate lyase [Paenibacillaceae bacterium]|jgi:hypothetical protein|nr:alginate lyase [Paenibacillaceae bacterium]
MKVRELGQPVDTPLTIQYKPDRDTKLSENPPRFTWMLEKEEGCEYKLEIASSPDFTGQTRVYEAIPYNFFTPESVFAPGMYYWRYAITVRLPDVSVQQSEWSAVRSFTVPGGLPETPLPPRDRRYDRISGRHPALWLDAEELERFREGVDRDSSFCGWDAFMEKSVRPWLDRPLIPEPQRYPQDKRVLHLWRQMYNDCQGALYAIRHLSVAGVVLQDRAILGRAKQWLLHVAQWDVNGPTSRDYNDEAAFRVAGAVAWGYDWLYDQLNEEERSLVLDVLYRRTGQVAEHVIERSKIHQVPYDSHAVRSLSSVLTPCCIAMWGDKPEAREWLDYTIEYYFCLFSPWGGEDGGWAEGPMYWTTGMAFLTEALNLIKKFNGIDIYRRPFFQRTGDFPLFCCPPDTSRASFGDQSNLGERPGLKTGALMRQFAGVTGNGMYQWYYEQVKAWDTAAEKKFFNNGWWDFTFDEMLYRHDFPEVKAAAPTELPPVKWFKDIGWVAMHHRPETPEEHVMLLTKSSPYGSLSHSHGDQNGFLLHAFGEPLAIESGYYIGFNTDMHKQWRRQTKSTNSLLIDGKGQYAEQNKLDSIMAKGRVEQVWWEDSHWVVHSDATLAYKKNVPYLKRYVREIYFVHQSYFVILDRVELEQPARIEWLMHALYPFHLEGQHFTVDGAKAGLYGKFIYSSSGKLALAQDDDFPGVNPEEWKGLPRQWHLSVRTEAAEQHTIATMLVPLKREEHNHVSYFIDDQGHGVFINFISREQSFCLRAMDE